MTAIEYTPFGPAKEFVEDDFMNELNQVAKVAPHFNHLIDAINTKKLKIKSGSPLDSIGKNVYILMFVGHSDHILETLGKKHKLLRGFPAIWIPGEYMKFFGFRPKFKNIDKQTQITVEYEGIAWFPKLSGFLGHLISFRIGNTIHWTACSKNSSDVTGGFSKDCARIWTPYVTLELLLNLEKNGAHMCAEMLSFNDMTHGSEVFKEDPIVTTMGEGSVFNLSKNSRGELIVNPVKMFDTEFVRFWGFKETIDFCVANNIPVCSATIATHSAAKKFMRLLGENQDKINNQLLDLIVSQVIKEHPNFITVIKGNRNHDQLLGNTIEGIVGHLITKSDSDEHQDIVTQIENGFIDDILKIKCPKYTGITMCIREAIKLGLIDDPQEFDNFVTRWANHWCVSKKGNKYWTEFYWAVMLLARKGNTDPENPVSWHIRLCNQIESEWSKLSESDLELIQESNRVEINKIIGENYQLIGQITVVKPFSDKSSLDQLEAFLQTNKFVTTQKKPPKGKKGWIKVTSIPTNPSKDTGRVYQLTPPENLQSWQTSKLDKLNSEVIHVTDDTLVDTINSDIFAEHQKMKESEDTVSPKELYLRESILSTRNQLLDTIQYLDSIKNDPDFQPRVFMLVGPQCIGKSWITKSLEEYGVNICSADKHMGPVYNFGRLQDCHYKCAMDVYNSILAGEHSCIDNTNTKAQDRGIYHDMCQLLGAKLVIIILAPELWLTCSEDIKNETLNVLVKRCEKRAREGKTIDSPEKVISRTIDISRKEIETIKIEGEDSLNTINRWKEWFPNPERKQGLYLDKGRILMARTSVINGIALEALQDDRLKERSSYSKDLLNTQMKRGRNEYHVTIVGPREMNKDIQRQLKTELDSYESEYQEPVPRGIGRATDEDGQEVFYVVLDWEWGDKVRTSLGLTEKRDFHITLMWSGDNDIHGVDKSIKSCEW